MQIDKARIYSADERARYGPRCPDCNAALALSWRRARKPGRPEDLFTIAKTSCKNHCDYDPNAIA